MHIKPVLKYGSETLISAPQIKLDILKRIQNKALGMITGAVVSTPIAALYSYTLNPPLAVELKKQAVNALVRLKAF